MTGISKIKEGVRADILKPIIFLEKNYGFPIVRSVVNRHFVEQKNIRKKLALIKKLEADLERMKKSKLISKN